jgi:hypothetical protein
VLTGTCRGDCGESLRYRLCFPRYVHHAGRCLGGFGQSCDWCGRFWGRHSAFWGEYACVGSPDPLPVSDQTRNHASSTGQPLLPLFSGCQMAQENLG